MWHDLEAKVNTVFMIWREIVSVCGVDSRVSFVSK